AAEGRPLALGAERLVVLPTVRIDDAQLRAALDAADTVVLLKAGGQLDRVRELLRTTAAGWSVRFARRVGLDGEEHRDDLDSVERPDDYVSLVVLRRPGTFSSRLAAT